MTDDIRGAGLRLLLAVAAIAVLLAILRQRSALPLAAWPPHEVLLILVAVLLLLGTVRTLGGLTLLGTAIVLDAARCGSPARRLRSAAARVLPRGLRGLALTGGLAISIGLSACSPADVEPGSVSAEPGWQTTQSDEEAAPTPPSAPPSDPAQPDTADTPDTDDDDEDDAGGSDGGDDAQDPGSPHDDEGDDAADEEDAPGDDAPAPSAPPEDTPPGDTIVVAAGDSLWSIAAEHVEDADPSAADIADFTQRLFAANRDLIGDDPHLIHPGQRLEAPS